MGRGGALVPVLWLCRMPAPLGMAPVSFSLWLTTPHAGCAVCCELRTCRACPCGLWAIHVMLCSVPIPVSGGAYNRGSMYFLHVLRDAPCPPAAAGRGAHNGGGAAHTSGEDGGWRVFCGRGRSAMGTAV